MSLGHQEQMFRIRQQDIAPEELMKSFPVHCIGGGGTGSNFCLMGAKVGFDITVYDGDCVGAENVNAQIFGPAHLGRPKVDAVREVCALLAGTEIVAINAFVSGGEPVNGVVVEALDSMEARSEVWHNVIVPRAPFIEAFVSIRMGAESGTVIVVKPSSATDQIWYETNGLYSSGVSLDLPCTGRAIAYNTSVAAALAVQQVKRLLMHQKPYRRIEFDLANLMFVVEE
jgi:hypothetical protein